MRACRPSPLMTDELFVTTNGSTTPEWNSVRPSEATSRSDPRTMLLDRAGLGARSASAPSGGLRRRRLALDEPNSLATIGLHQPKKLIHVCWDNHPMKRPGSAHRRPPRATGLCRGRAGGGGPASRAPGTSARRRIWWSTAPRAEPAGTPLHLGVGRAGPIRGAGPAVCELENKYHFAAMWSRRRTSAF